MKKIIKISYLAVVIFVTTAVLSGCKDFLDVNKDPTRLTPDAPIQQVMTSGIASLTFYQGLDLHLYSSLFSQQAAGAGPNAQQARVYDSYVVSNADVNNAFSNYYANTLADLDYITKKAPKQGLFQHVGVAKIMKAFAYQNLVDAWGNVPYKGTFKGAANFQPAYDDSKEIYDSLFVLIDSGMANLLQSSTISMSSADDLVYGGNMARWEKFANTLKLRLALHYAKDDGGTKLKALISSLPNDAVATSKFIASNAESFQVVYENVANRQNPIHQFELTRQDYWAPSTTFVNMMNAKADPRRPFYFTPSPIGAATYPNWSGATYTGFTSNNSQTFPNSRMHTYLRGVVTGDTGARNGATFVSPTAPAVTYTGDAPNRMLTFAEYNFIRAEAIIMYAAPGPTGVGAGTLLEAQAYLQAGITACMQDAGVTSANITTYVTAQGTLIGTPATDLQKIIEEKWVALYGVAMEPWTDWRRTGYPVLAPSAAGVAQGNTTIPRCLVYPLSEQQTNAVNVPTRPNMNSKSIFWDK